MNRVLSFNIMLAVSFVYTMEKNVTDVDTKYHAATLKELCLETIYSELEKKVIEHNKKNTTYFWCEQEPKNYIKKYFSSLPTELVYDVMDSKLAVNLFDKKPEEMSLLYDMQAMSPDQKLGICLDKQTGKPLLIGENIKEHIHTQGRAIFGCGFSPNNKYVALTQDNCVEVYDVSNKPFRVASVDGKYRCFLPIFLDNQTVLVGDSNGIYRISFLDNIIECKQYLSEQLLSETTCATHDNVIFADRLCQNNPTIKVVDKSTRTIKKTLSGHSAYIDSLSSCESGLIASGSFDETVRVWDVTKPKGQECIAVLHHPATIHSAIFNQQGTWVISGGEDCIIRIWDFVKKVVLFSCQSRSSIVFLSCGPESLIFKTTTSKVYRFPNKLRTILKEMLQERENQKKLITEE